MGPHIDGYRGRLAELGYTAGTVRNMLKDAGQLGRWMARADVEVSQLHVAAVDAFLESRRSRGSGRVQTVRAFEPLLAYLRAQDALAEENPGSATPVDDLLSAYKAWLVDERGLAGPTVLRYENLARRFLTERAAAVGAAFICQLTGADVVAFLSKEAARVSVGAATGRVAELRSLLRFLYLKSLTPLPLATAVPPLAG